MHSIAPLTCYIPKLFFGIFNERSIVEIRLLRDYSKFGSTRRPTVDWLYWNIHADAVSFDSGDKGLTFRPPCDEHHQSKEGIIVTTEFKLTSQEPTFQSLHATLSLDMEVSSAMVLVGHADRLDKDLWNTKMAANEVGSDQTGRTENAHAMECSQTRRFADYEWKYVCLIERLKERERVSSRHGTEDVSTGPLGEAANFPRNRCGITARPSLRPSLSISPSLKPTSYGPLHTYSHNCVLSFPPKWATSVLLRVGSVKPSFARLKSGCRPRHFKQLIPTSIHTHMHMHMQMPGQASNPRLGYPRPHCSLVSFHPHPDPPRRLSQPSLLTVVAVYAADCGALYFVDLLLLLLLLLLCRQVGAGLYQSSISVQLAVASETIGRRLLVDIRCQDVPSPRATTRNQSVVGFPRPTTFRNIPIFIPKVEPDWKVRVIAECDYFRKGGFSESRESAAKMDAQRETDNQISFRVNG
ncbi:unnamed protein product [Protopolystoma xenopodis]|uniref:Uncharacterized protein n=1 Tax=Protopolystoma xenopodis TaxID=117903 RepID=A0A448WK47_9PLAT|nr:unnamed protein product [Protopolystoma xenopodis]